MFLFNKRFHIWHTYWVSGNEQLWPLLLAMTCVPCIVSLFVLPFVPDSPRYLLVNQDDQKAAEDGEYCELPAGCRTYSMTL